MNKRSLDDSTWNEARLAFKKISRISNVLAVERLN